MGNLFKTHNNAKQKIVFLISIFFVIFLVSCSHEVISEQETVSKKEFDELKAKYDSLLAEKNAALTSEISVNLKEDELATATSTLEIYEPETQFVDLEKVQDLIEKGDFAPALETLKKIENSDIKQLKVRAKFLQGEIFFKQSEWDLAMQKYDEIITGYGFSSVAISAIEKLDLCKKNLNRPITQEPYHLIYEEFSKS